jgi:oligopeptide transport system ATP-binding protein
MINPATASETTPTPLAAPPVGETLLRVEHLKKHFIISSGWGRANQQTLKAVDDVSFAVGRGETLGLVGESGCGKTTTGRLILRLIEPSAGSAWLGDSPDLMTLAPRQMLPYRRRMQMIFQDPYSSLNPRMTIGSTIAEALVIHGLARGRREKRVAELLDVVGLPADTARRYPHEMSGGQRQRVGIARALAVEPELIIADEPVSALDVSIQAQIINLLEDLRSRLGLSYLFIAHDLSVVGHISHRVAVMYLGKIVELGPCREVFTEPLHPYTQALLQAIPKMDPTTGRKRLVLEGDVPSPINPPAGCPFHTRCPKAMPQCSQVIPELKEHRPGHWAACLLYE